MFTISLIQESEFSEWNSLWQKYLEFYESSVDSSVTEKTWKRIHSSQDLIFCFGAYISIREQNKLVGFTNFLYHPTTWSREDYCYLEDLFVNYNERSNGVGRLLIEEVSKHCKQIGVSRLYWKTQEHNYVGRILYDKVAKNNGFLEYEREI